MINYREGKTKYSHSKLGSTYIDESKLNDGDPVIYICGQMEPKGHVKEAKTGKTADKNHNNFTGSWMYEYDIKTSDKTIVNGRNMAMSLIKDLEEAKLGDVTLITGSYGGIIGAYASKSELIKKVIAVHPPILGTPIANPKYVRKLQLGYTKLQKLLLLIISQTNPYAFGFEHENFRGIRGIDLKDVDLNKLLVVGNAIDPNTEKNPLILQFYDIVKKVTNQENDGVVIYDEDEFNKLGINYSTTEEHDNHLKYANPDNMQKILRLNR